MNGYVEDIESIFDEFDTEAWEERQRRGGRTSPLRTPSRRSSFMQRTPPSAATQGQVQAATRNIDSKIETLSNAVKALEGRTNTIATEQTKMGSALTTTRGDLQQTKTLGVLLPFITQKPVELTSGDKTYKVLTQSSNQLVQFLPLFLLLSPTGGGGNKGGAFADPTMLILLAAILGDRA